MIVRLVGLPLCLVLVALAGCSDDSSPEQQVRAAIEQMEAAAEARDVDALMEHIAENYRDSQGRERTDIARALRGYFLVNQSIHLLTRIESVQFPTTDEARLQLQVGMAGREAQGGALDLSAEVREFAVVLVREDGDWKVSYADSRVH